MSEFDGFFERSGYSPPACGSGDLRKGSVISRGAEGVTTFPGLDAESKARVDTELRSLLAYPAGPRQADTGRLVRACVFCASRTGSGHVWGWFELCPECGGAGGHQSSRGGLGNPESEEVCPACEGSGLEGLI